MLSDLWNRLIAWTGTLVVPDWGALVTLIPVLLLLVVGVFVAITAAKWARVGPVRRGPGRRQPLAPDGTPLHGPSWAPLVLAAGAFLLAVGLVAGGPWLAAGIVVAAVGLTWWALEFRRDSRGPRVVAASTTRPRSTTSSRRPSTLTAVASLLLLSIGLVLGGAVLGAGIVATVASLLWWSADLRRPETADIEIEADAAPATTSTPRPRVTPLRVAVVVAAVAMVGVLAATSKVVPDAPGGSTVPTIPPSAPTASLPAADATLVAQNIAFVPTALAAPAGRPFTVAFDNRDNAPHNLEIRDAAGSVLFRGDIVTGPIVTVYAVPALPAGTYPFICTVHPAMTGTLTAK